MLPAPIVSAGVLFALSIPSPLVTANDKMAVVLGGLGAAVTTILEEIGWTGFVVPRLRRHANLTAYRVLMVWVYDRTGSLPVTTLLHGMLTASSIFWFTPVATGTLFLAYVWLVATATWLLVGAVAAVNGYFFAEFA